MQMEGLGVKMDYGAGAYAAIFAVYVYIVARALTAKVMFKSACVFESETINLSRAKSGIRGRAD